MAVVLSETIDIDFLQSHPCNVKIYGEEDVTELVDYIRESKWVKPLLITQNNRIISGHRRWQAARILGIERVPYVRQIFETETDELKALLLENASRDKTPEQKVREGTVWKKIEERESLKRMAEGANSTNKLLDRVAIDTGSENFHTPSDKGRTNDKVAERVGFGTGRTYEKAAKVVEIADKMREEGKVTEAQGLLETLNKRSVSAAIRVLKEQEREQKRDVNRQLIAKAQTIEEALRAGKFPTIMIDPPWDWGDEGDIDQFGRARPTYGTMTIGQLLSLPVGNYADDNSHIYLWITNRSLPKGFELLEAWGFRYITCITWKKPHFGMGNYFRGQTEHMLFGVKGSLMLKSRNVGTIFDAPRGPNGHSSKPLEAYTLIESCSQGPYLELFARSNRQDWTSWGAEV